MATTDQKFRKLTAIRPANNGKWLFKCDCGNEKEIRYSNVASGITASCGRCKTREIIGKQFGKLTVIGYLDNKKYLCHCECGNDTEVFRCNLTRGVTKSCGCGRIADWTGKPSGKLKVIRFEYIKDGETYWACHCECGNDITVSRQHLGKHGYKSCGCSRRDYSIIGQTFGKLKVIAYSHTQSKNAYWLCHCECGNDKAICGVHLKVGSARSCGCTRNISQSELTKVMSGLVNKARYIIETDYTPEILYNEETSACQQIDIAVLDQDGNIVFTMEYDGRQHFEPVGFGEKDPVKIAEKFANQQQRDARKNEILKKYGIPLIRIPYTEKLTKENIVSILKQNGIIITDTDIIINRSTT